MRCGRVTRYLAYVPRGVPCTPATVVAAAAAASSPVATRDAMHNVTTQFRRTEAAVLRNEVAVEQQRGFFALPLLDYDALAGGVAPLLSRQQFALQYHVFHADAVRRLNAHTLGSELEGHSLHVVLHHTAFDASRAVVHTAAAEHFNYCFWYRSLRPWGTAVPARLREGLQTQYASQGIADGVAEVQRRVLVTALSAVGQLCGWVYVVWTGGAFDVMYFAHGTCPIASDVTPLLALNLHASAMYMDYATAGGDTEGGELGGSSSSNDVTASSSATTTAAATWCSSPEPPHSEAAMVERYVRNYFKACNWLLAERYYLAGLHTSETNTTS